MRQCDRPRAATCGECVTTSTWRSRASRASRSPTAAAVAPPTPLSTSSKIRVGDRPVARQHHLQRQHEPRQLAARGDLVQRPERRAGIGRDQEGDAVHAALAQAALRQPIESGYEARLLELQRRQLVRHRLVQSPPRAFLRAAVIASAAAS